MAQSSRPVHIRRISLTWLWTPPFEATILTSQLALLNSSRGPGPALFKKCRDVFVSQNPPRCLAPSVENNPPRHSNHPLPSNRCNREVNVEPVFQGNALRCQGTIMTRLDQTPNQPSAIIACRLGLFFYFHFPGHTPSQIFRKISTHHFSPTLLASCCLYRVIHFLPCLVLSFRGVLAMPSFASDRTVHRTRITDLHVVFVSPLSPIITLGCR